MQKSDRGLWVAAMGALLMAFLAPFAERVVKLIEDVLIKDIAKALLGVTPMVVLGGVIIYCLIVWGRERKPKSDASMPNTTVSTDSGNKLIEMHSNLVSRLDSAGVKLVLIVEAECYKFDEALRKISDTLDSPHDTADVLRVFEGFSSTAIYSVGTMKAAIRKYDEEVIAVRAIKGVL